MVSEVCIRTLPQTMPVDAARRRGAGASANADAGALRPWNAAEVEGLQRRAWDGGDDDEARGASRADGLQQAVEAANAILAGSR